MNVTNRILLFVLLPVCIFSVSASFYRFLIAEDYMVEYHGPCNPAADSCFFDCADDECREPNYYVWVAKKASEVHAQCGEDVTQCESALLCSPSDTHCSIRYCSEESVLEDEACEDIEGKDLEMPLQDERVIENFEATTTIQTEEL